MAAPAILVVEDSAVFRRAARHILEKRGYRVIEALDGKTALGLVRQDPPDLVLLDTSLPDFPAGDLVAKIRRLPGGEALPVVALLGILARPGEADLAGAGFQDFLVKPLEPARLTESVDALLGWAGERADRPGRGKRVLLVDDDPDYLGVARIRFSLLGFEVDAAADGREALERARARRPDAIASDILMPRLDGLGLCVEVRADPGLRDLPVILFSGSYLEKADRKLARDAGCTDFVPRTEDLKTLVDRVVEAVGGSAAPAAPPSPEKLEEERRRRALLQLERQAARNILLSRRNRLLDAQLSILAGVSEALARSRDIDRALRDAFVDAFDSWSVGSAALYALGPGGTPVLRARSGWPDEAVNALEGFLGHPDMAAHALKVQKAIPVIPTGDPRAPADDLLDRAGMQSALVVPLLAGGEGAGVLLLGSPRGDLFEQEVVTFAETVGGQLAQALSLARVVGRLRASEERYRALVENANDALFLLDEQWEIQEVNLRAEELLGRPSAEILLHRLRDFADPDAPDAGWDGLRARAGEGTVRAETAHLLRPDGSPVAVELSAARVAVGGKTLVLAIARDITPRRRLERRLFAAKKMEAIGQLAGGVAHDFNNLLMVINGYSEILLGRIGEGAPGRREIEEILRAGQKAASLTSQLLGFSRRQVSRPRVLDLRSALADQEKELRRILGPEVALEVRHAPDLRPVKIDPSQLEQTLSHLFANAREAMGSGGTVTVETANVELDEEFARENDGARPGPCVMLAVADTGAGMDEETLARAFEPFFTTKEPGKGSGLGLATVYGIVKQNDGYVRIESRRGQGTTVRLYLPQVAPVPGPPLPERPPSPPGAEGPSTVLLVEDEWGVRALIVHILRGAGYRVLEASTGAEAVEVAGGAESPPELLLTDVVMPGMGGREVARRLRDRLPALKVLYMSGYSYDALLSEEGDELDADFLSKPFAPDVLLARVRELLRPARKES